MLMRVSMLLMVPAAFAQTTCADLKAAYAAAECCAATPDQPAILPGCPATSTCQRIRAFYQYYSCCAQTPNLEVGDPPPGTCVASAYYDLNPNITRVPLTAATADTSLKLMMAWDRMQVEEKTNLYGRLLDNFNENCEVDGYCFGDLFYESAWICTVAHVPADPFPIYSEIVPNGVLSTSGEATYGPACTAGGISPSEITAAFQPLYGTNGIFMGNGMQPRHTVNNFVVTAQDTTSMTTQHYQIIERFIAIDEHFISYDGSGYTVELSWTKVGSGYSGLWQITEFREVWNGHGHLGIPPNATAALAQTQAFINSLRALGGFDPFAVTTATPPTYVAATLPSPSTNPTYGNLNPLITRIPSPTSDAHSVQLLWDRFDVLEHISMYSWLSDETRHNLPLGFAWGDMFSDDSNFCIFAQGSSFNTPPFDSFALHTTFEGRPFTSGGLCPDGSAACNQCTNGETGGAEFTCAGTCALGTGAYSQDIMQNMINGGFGVNSAAQTRHQQTRHTLTNKIILFQNDTYMVTQVSNTLERFINGIAYDNSFFLYQHRLVKVAGIWKFKQINAFAQGHGALAAGLPPPSEFVPFIEGIADFPGSTGRTTGRKLSEAPGPGQATTKGPLGPEVRAPNIQLNPLVSRIPVGVLQGLARGDVPGAVDMAWDRLEIIERVHMYPWLADELRRNGPLGNFWGNLYSDGGYFCQFQYMNVSLYRPSWAENKPGYVAPWGTAGTFSGATFSNPLPASAVPPGSGITSSCSYGLGTYAQGAMQATVAGFGEGGPFQILGQQTRHTFSNIVFLLQTETAASTLNYNIVERYVNHVAMDGSNFIYNHEHAKINGVWHYVGVTSLHFGDDRLGAVPTPGQWAAWLAFLGTGPTAPSSRK